MTRWAEAQLRTWVFARTQKVLCERFQLANRYYWHMPVRLTWWHEEQCYAVTDTKPSEQGGAPICLRIARPERVFRYRRGVADRIHRLALKYCLDQITFSPGDTVVDCGANVGEIGVYLSKDNAPLNYVACEPSEPEARACDANNFGGDAKTHRLALWKETAELTFYESNETADSSLIEPPLYAGKTTIQAVSLPGLFARCGIDKVHLLKLEAEGAEPEILAGSGDVLDRVTYCAVDCGPERGTEQAHVIPAVVNYLTARNFELLDVHLDRQIFLFRNRTTSD